MSTNNKKSGNKSQTEAVSTVDTPTPDATQTTQETGSMSTTTAQIDTPVEGSTVTASADDNKKTTTKSKLDALRKKAEVSRDKSLAEAVNRIELFDSTKASEWKTKGTGMLGTVKTEANSLMINGRNIGAEQREPEWSDEQMEVITRAKSSILQTMPVTNTRRSVMDPEMEFVGRDANGSIVPTEKAYLSSLDPSRYCIGLGPEKFDTTGSPRYYADVVVADINGEWLVNQWTSEGVVIEGVAPAVLMQANRPGNTSGRRIGIHFARIGLPAHAFGPLFNTLGQKFPGCLSQVTSTDGYYWMNASWGVSSFSATFSYINADGKTGSTNSLSDVMKMLDGKSSLCLGTVAISITCNAKMVDGKPTADKSSFGLSIKMHNAFGVNVVDYHGPPQQGSTGMMIPARIVQKAQAMGKKGGMATGGGGSIFSTQTNVFSGAGLAVPSIKPANDKDYM